MQIEKLDHVHLIVRDIEAAMTAFKTLLGDSFFRWDEGGAELLELGDIFGVRIAFHPIGVILMQVTDSPKAQASTVGGRGGFPDSTWKPGVSHISFRVPSLDDAITEMVGKGWNLIQYDGRAPLHRDASFQFPGIPTMLMELSEYEGDHILYAAKRDMNADVIDWNAPGAVERARAAWQAKTKGVSA